MAPAIVSRSGVSGSHTLAERVHFPIVGAWVCMDCDTVTNVSRACPACASESLYSLARLLRSVDVAVLRG
jgi:hypothetical protein